MTNNHSAAQFLPVTTTELNEYDDTQQQQQQRRTPSPVADGNSHNGRTNSNATMNMMMMTSSTTSTTTSDYSPVPGGVQSSSHSSPGSASDHMGVLLPNTVNSSSNSANSSNGTGIQPLFHGSSVLAAFDAGKPNLYNHHHQQQQQHPPSIPTSGGILVKSPVLARRKGGGTTNTTTAITFTTEATNNMAFSNGTGTQQQQQQQPTGNTNRRQSRLQRNRESARLSRKRRKQYLELLEERVDKISETLDESRRQHVAEAVTTFHQKRMEWIQQQQQPQGEQFTLLLSMMNNNLARTNEELMIATTYQYQQLKSFSIPPSMQFTLWLTLQTDTYFRGGRTASERLSAARIGERMLSSGTESAAPSQSMWPLFCNEIGLSYDQEEKLRAIQRTLIQDHSSWIDRHTAFASRKVIETAHDATQALTFRAGQRERSTMSILSTEQRMKMMQWSLHNRERVTHSTMASVPTIAPQRNINSQYHVAANLYLLNDHLHQLLFSIPRAAPLLTGAALKKLSHRPSFEPLGASEERPNEIDREGSFPSSGSLKRNASEISMECDESSNGAQKPQVPVIRPVDAQATATPAIQQALSMVLDLLPPEPPIDAMMATAEEQQLLPDDILIDDIVSSLDLPMPTPVLSATLQTPSMPIPSLIYQAPAAYTQSAPSFGALQPPHAQQHVRKSSFLPAHLTVVPEEIWPDDADEFLLDMIEGDWAIGEGIDMDMPE